MRMVKAKFFPLADLIVLSLRKVAPVVFLCVASWMLMVLYASLNRAQGDVEMCYAYWDLALGMVQEIGENADTSVDTDSSTITWEESAELKLSTDDLAFVSPKGWVFGLRMVADTAGARSLGAIRTREHFVSLLTRGVVFGCDQGKSVCVQVDQRPAEGTYEFDYPASSDLPFDNAAGVISNDTLIFSYTEKGGTAQWQATYDIGAFYSGP